MPSFKVTSISKAAFLVAKGASMPVPEYDEKRNGIRLMFERTDEFNVLLGEMKSGDATVDFNKLDEVMKEIRALVNRAMIELRPVRVIRR